MAAELPKCKISVLKRTLNQDLIDEYLEDAYKDIVNVQKMGVDKKAMLPVVNAMIASYQAAMAAGYGREPKSAMLKIYEDALGVQFRHPKEKA